MNHARILVLFLALIATTFINSGNTWMGTWIILTSLMVAEFFPNKPTK